MGVRDKFRGFQRKTKTKPSGDPDGVLATLLVTKRLLKERGSTDFFAALDEAVDLAAPKDPVRCWWSAHRAFADALPAGNRGGVIGFIDGEDTVPEDVDAVLVEAIRAQGILNLAASKGKRP